MTDWSTEFAGRRHLAAFHLGMGDIRITMADQDEIVALQARLAEAEALLRDILDCSNPCDACVARIDAFLAGTAGQPSVARLCGLQYGPSLHDFNPDQDNAERCVECGMPTGFHPRPADQQEVKP